MRIAPQFHKAIIALVLAAANDATAAITFTGLNENLEKNARALMPLAAAPCNMARWRVERLFRNSDKQLRDALEALGRYKFEMSKSLSFIDPDCWSADINVVLGEPTRWRNVELTIIGEAREDDWIAQRTRLQMPVSGSVLNHGEYGKYKQQLQSALQTRGYFEAEFTKSAVTVDESLSMADMQLELQSGPRYRFGTVEFTDNVLRPGLLQGYADFHSGDHYDAGAVSQLQESLSGSGYFGSVSIQADPSEDGSHLVPVNVNITPGLRRVYTAGLGFATDIGVQGRLGFANRRLNDRGHQFDSRFFLSAVDSQITSAYRWPRGNPKAEWVDVFGGLQAKRTETSESDKITLGVRVARNRTKNWLETPYINFTGEDSRVAEEVETSRLVILGINWQTTIGREISRIRSGHRISLDVRGSNENFGSDTTFLQLTGSTKWVRALGEKNRLLMRADLGTTMSKDFQNLPATVSFFTGGDNSVRGYGFETLGQIDDAGNVVGGRHLAAFSIEIDRLFAEKWSVAAFADIGDAFDDINSVALKTGIGLGLRWYSPLGPVRVDVAHPLDDSGRNFRLHISLGPDL